MWRNTINSFFIFVSVISLNVAGASEEKYDDVIFLCQSNNYSVKVFKISENKLLAYFYEGDDKKEIMGSYEVVDFPSHLDSNGLYDFSFSHYFRYQYDISSLEFWIGSKNIEVYYHYSGEDDPNNPEYNNGFSINVGGNSTDYQCDSGFVSNLSSLDNYDIKS